MCSTLLPAPNLRSYTRAKSGIVSAGQSILAVAPPSWALRATATTARRPAPPTYFDVATGTQLFKLTPNDAKGFDSFGISVAIDGTKAIVGAYQNSGGFSNFGSAYLFVV